MKIIIRTIGLALVFGVANVNAADSTSTKENVFAPKPFGIKVSIKMIGPYAQAADLPIICLFKHKAAGDAYEGAAKATDEHQEHRIRFDCC